MTPCSFCQFQALYFSYGPVHSAMILPLPYDCVNETILINKNSIETMINKNKLPWTSSNCYVLYLTIFVVLRVLKRTYTLKFSILSMFFIFIAKKFHATHSYCGLICCNSPNFLIPSFFSLIKTDSDLQTLNENSSKISYL